MEWSKYNVERLIALYEQEPVLCNWTIPSKQAKKTWNNARQRISCVMESVIVEEEN